MAKVPSVKVKELVSVLERLGFAKHHQIGSHAQFKHFDGRRVTVSIHHGREIKRGTLRSIINDLGMTVEEFINLL